jgi:chemotaxis protein MotB
LARKNQQEERSGGGIVVLYTSLMILLLAFFILLNTMSKTEEARVEAAFQSLAGSFGFTTGDLSPLDAKSKLRHATAAPIKKIDQDYRSLRGLIRDPRLKDLVKLLRSDSFKTVAIPDVLLFEPGTLDLSPEGQDFLARVAEIIRDGEYPLSLNGHTDSAPPPEAVAFNNWELSAKRALVVVRYLIAQGVEPKRLAAVGMADTQPMIAPRPDNPQAVMFNNRVELVMDARDTAQDRLPDAGPVRNLNLRGFWFDFWNTGKELKEDQEEDQ